MARAFNLRRPVAATQSKMVACTKLELSMWQCHRRSRALGRWCVSRVGVCGATHRAPCIGWLIGTPLSSSEMSLTRARFTGDAVKSASTQRNPAKRS